MVQNLYRDGPKMASWRVLGPFGGQVGPKMEPIGFQGLKTQFVPPMLGPKLVISFFYIFITRVVHKRLEDLFGLHVVSRHQFLGDGGLPET